MLRKIGFFLSLLFILLLFVIFASKNLFYFQNLKYLYKDLISSIGKEKSDFIESDNITPYNFVNFGNDVSFISNSEFGVFSPTLKKKMKINHNFEYPVVKTSKYKSLIYDSSGTEYIVTSKYDVLYKGNLDSKIITGEISEFNNLVFVTESDEYCCEMRVIDLHGNDKYRYYFSKMYLVDVSINDDGTKIAVCGIKSENGNVKSVIQIFDIKTEIPIFEKEFENNLFSSINFFSNDNIIFIGENSVVCLKNFGKCINVLEYPEKNKKICLYDFNKDFGEVISFSPSNDDRNQYIIVIDKNGNQISKIETGKKIKSISLKKKLITVLSENKIILYTIDGKILRQKTVPPYCKKVFLSDAWKAYILGDNKITTQKLSKFTK